MTLCQWHTFTTIARISYHNNTETKIHSIEVHNAQWNRFLFYFYGNFFPIKLFVVVVNVPPNLDGRNFSVICRNYEGISISNCDLRKKKKYSHSVVNVVKSFSLYLLLICICWKDSPLKYHKFICLLGTKFQNKFVFCQVDTVSKRLFYNAHN